MPGLNRLQFIGSRPETDFQIYLHSNVKIIFFLVSVVNLLSHVTQESSIQTIGKIFTTQPALPKHRINGSVPILHHDVFKQVAEPAVPMMAQVMF